MSESKLIREALKQIFEAAADPLKRPARANSITTANTVPSSAADPLKRPARANPNNANRSEQDFNDRNAARSGPLAGSGPVSAGATSLDRDDIALRTTEMENKRKMAAQAERRAEAAGPGEMGSVSVSPKEVKKEPEVGTVFAGGANTMGAEATPEEDYGKPTTPFRMSIRRPITPTPDTSDAKAETPKPAASHKVQKGENLWNIIKQRGKTAGKTMSNTDIANEVKRLAQLNKMKDPNKIMPGQEIKFEEKEMTISKSLIDAFNGVVSSKHPNVFQEAKKKTAKEKQLAALAEPKDKITHKDVLVGRGVFKEEIESIFSEAELAYFEGVGKIAGKPNDKSVPAGKDTSNATGSRSGTLSDEYVEEGRRGRPPKGESLGANELHMNAKRAADNMDNVKHTFANGQEVKMTKPMGVGFLSRHRAAKTADDKDDILNHAHSSLSAFKDVVEGKPIPKKKKKGISLAGNM